MKSTKNSFFQMPTTSWFVIPMEEDNAFTLPDANYIIKKEEDFFEVTK